MTLLGCGSSDDGDVGGSGTGGDGSDGTFDIQEESFFGADASILQGTVELPMTLDAGTGIQVGIATSVPSSPWTGNEVFGGSKKHSSTTFSFRIENVDAGNYVVFARADADDSGTFGSGDLGGYYSGTVEAPILEPAGASLGAVSAGATGNLSFGLGPIP
jgi:hypothetical protein